MAQRPALSALLIDLSGTVHIGSKPTTGAIEAIDKLRAHGIPFRFCSNTSKESTAAVKARLQRMGIYLRNAEKTSPFEEVWTSIGSVKRSLQDLGVQRPYLLLSDSATEELESSVVLTDDTPYDAVVIGLAPSLFDYHHLNTAFRILAGEPRQDSLIATHKARYIESTSPPGLSLGPGPFVEALEFATGAKAQILGKPTKRFFSTVIEDFKRERIDLPEGKIAIIGDDVEADLGEGAIELGLWRVLVRTGKYRPGDENKPGLVPPNETCDSLSEFVDKLLETRNSDGRLENSVAHPISL